MKSLLTLFVGSHDRHQLDGFESKSWIRKVLFQDLNFEGRVSDQSLAENRLFQSREALEVDTEFVGIISPRIFARHPSLGNMDLLGKTLGKLLPDERWSPYSTPVTSRRQLHYWVCNQEQGLPGISRTLRHVIEVDYQKKKPIGGVFLGNQFVVHSEIWRDFVLEWRRNFQTVLDMPSSDREFTFRCTSCGALKPDGYFRYGPNRSLGFIGERLTSLSFAHRELKAGPAGDAVLSNFKFKMAIDLVPSGLTDVGVRLLNSVRTSNAPTDCSVCTSFDPNDPRPYSILES